MHPQKQGEYLMFGHLCQVMLSVSLQQLTTNLKIVKGHPYMEEEQQQTAKAKTRTIIISYKVHVRAPASWTPTLGSTEICNALIFDMSKAGHVICTYHKCKNWLGIQCISPF